MIRAAVAADRDAMDRFLADYTETSMFLRSNLATQGVGISDHPHSTDFILKLDGGQITGVLGLTKEGFGLCQGPSLSSEDWRAMALHFKGRVLAGISGDAPQIAKILTALDLPETAIGYNDIEPLYRLDLSDLPAVTDVVRPPEPFDLPLLAAWFENYRTDTGLPPNGDPKIAALNRAESSISNRNTRLLVEDGKPVAMTSFNARFADMVQIGGVYTPPNFRGNGFAGRVVAAHLAEVHKAGFNTAILFAINSAAARAYEKIGFQKIGAYHVVVMTKDCSPLFMGADV